jgi:hypothetical protein
VEYLRDMYDDIFNDESDHWNPMSENPIIPESQQDPIDVENVDEEAEDEHVDMFHDWDYQEDESAEVNEVSPTIRNEKKRPRVVIQIPKKPKSSTTLVIQEQITKIADSASSFSSKKQGDITIKEVMDLVLKCGADYGSNEHDIATQLFVKRDQREMFLTLPTNEIRFQWLIRRYKDKYGN